MKNSFISNERKESVPVVVVVVVVFVSL
jgi:hypothetical protein